MSVLEEFARELEKSTPGGVSSEADLIKHFFDTKNIDGKTELANPLSIALQESILDFLADEFGPDLAKFQRTLIKRYKVNMLSHNRKSRGEALESLKKYKEAVVRQAKNVIEKLNET